MAPLGKFLLPIISPVSGVSKVDIDAYGRVIATHALTAGDLPTFDTSKISDFATAVASIVTNDIGITIQAEDADLNAIAVLSPADGTFIKRSGGIWTAGTLSVSDIPTLTAAKISDFNAVAQAQAASVISTDIGTSLQAYNTNLDTIAALAPSNGTFIRRTGGVWVAVTLASGDIPNNAANTSGSAASLSSVLLAAAFPALTGDVTTVAGALSTTLKPSVTIVTPTIASFTNAQHTHQNAAGGGSLDAAAIATGVLALARGGTNADLSASGSSTAFLAQDASHVVTARAIIAADIPTLTASKISDFTSTVNTILASPPAIGGSAAAAGTFTALTAQNEIISQTATTGSPASELVITGAAHTALTASTEYTDVNLNLARTVQFATGAINTLRAVRIQAPTYSFVGTSVITNAATLSIDGAPVAGTNANPTNTQAVMVTSSGTPVTRISGPGNVHIGNNTSGFSNVDGNGTGFSINQSSRKYAGLLAGTQAVGFIVDNTARFVIDAASSYTTMFNSGASWPFQMFPTTNHFLVSDGSVSNTDPGVKLSVIKNDTSTAAVTNILTLTHALTTANAGANSIGTGLLFQAADSTSAIGAGVSQGRIRTIWTTATDASRVANMVLSVFDTAEHDMLTLTPSSFTLSSMISCSNTGTMQLGWWNSGADYTISAPSAVAGNGNRNGARLVVQGGQSTGTGNTGPIAFQVSLSGGLSGSALNAYKTVLTLTDIALTASAVFFPVQAPTVSAPAYVEGGIYYDQTLHKLRIGGASGWETVTSS